MIFQNSSEKKILDFLKCKEAVRTKWQVKCCQMDLNLAYNFPHEWKLRSNIPLSTTLTYI